MNIESRTYSAGLSLVELMVAMVIGLFLVGGLATLAFNSKKAYETQDYAARLQENARFAMQFLSYDLRMAGYSGCAGVAGGLEGQDPSSDGYGDVVQFFYADPDLVTQLSADASGDTLSVLSVGDLLQPHEVAEDLEGQEIAAADCGGADVVEVKIDGVNGNTLTVIEPGTALEDPPKPGLSRRGYSTANTEIQRFGTYTYQIIKPNPNVSNPFGCKVPGLFRIDAGIVAADIDCPDEGDELPEGVEEMVEGVEYMRLLYGEDTTGNGAPDEYLPEDQVSNWSAVKSMKIGLLLRSVSNYSSDAVPNPDREYGPDATSGPYEILDLTGDDAVDPPQGSLRVQRRVFVNTVFVRNQT